MVFSFDALDVAGILRGRGALPARVGGMLMKRKLMPWLEGLTAFRGVAATLRLTAVVLLVPASAGFAQNVSTSAQVDLQRYEGTPENDSAADSTQPVSTSSAAISVGSAAASATFGELRTFADLYGLDSVSVPDLSYASSYASASFDDQVHIGGSNVGEMAQVSLVYEVDGTLVTPIGPVSEITNYATAAFDAYASTDLDYDYVSDSYFVTFGNLTASFFVQYVVTVDVLVDSYVNFAANLQSDAATNINYDGLLESDFDSTARLIGFRLEGVDDPVLTSTSGTTYAIVPEPATFGLLVVGALAALPLARRRGFKTGHRS